jgi:DNA recombination protein RmuC
MGETLAELWRSDPSAALLLLAMGAIIGALAVWLARRPAEVGRERDLAEAIRRADLATAERVCAEEAARASAQEAAEAGLRAARAEEAARPLAELRVELAEARATVGRLDAERAAALARAEEVARAHAEQVAQLTTLRSEIEARLAHLSQTALDATQTRFLEVARELQEAQRAKTEAEADSRRQAIEATVQPIRETLGRYAEELARLDQARAQREQFLSAEINQLRESSGRVSQEAAKLINALRAAPKARGRWGELQLRNVLELAGLREGVDYDIEVTVTGDEGRLRPDAVLRLPGGQRIVVDAKTPLSGYLDAVDAVDETERDRHLRAHAQALRKHVSDLAAKEYQAHVDDAVNFVVMFVPGENFLAAAIEREPRLMEEALGQKIVLCSPVTLIALARTVALAWQQQALTDNARDILDLGRDLFTRLQKIGGDVLAVGKALDGAVSRYNGLVASLETRVMPAARRFGDLGVAGHDEALAEFAAVETRARLPRPGRDLALEDQSGATQATPG